MLFRSPIYPPRARGLRHRWALLAPACVALAVVAVLYSLSQGLVSRLGTVVIYTSQDQVYAEPILREFERRTGLRVRAVYDSEAVKTVGLANRLLAEKDHPQCDVFWSNEELRTRQLAVRGVFAETNAWVAVGYRSRRLVINTNRVHTDGGLWSLAELTNSHWSGKVALAYPLFGTTATHFLALRQHWGEARWEAWCRGLQANRPFLLDGNSVVVRWVGRGEAWIGLTDSDDIAAGQRDGYPITALPLTEESLLIPNTVAVVRGAPHPLGARKLAEFLQRPDVAERLVAGHALESGTAPALAPAATLQPDWGALVHDLEPATAALKTIFLR